MKAKLSAAEKARQAIERDVVAALEAGRTAVGAVNIAGAQVFTGYSRNTINRAVALGHLSSIVTSSRRMFLIADLVAWLAFLKQRTEAGDPVVYSRRDQPDPLMPADKRTRRGRPPLLTREQAIRAARDELRRHQAQDDSGTEE